MTTKMMGLSLPAYHRFDLGRFQATSYRDGAVHRDGPHPAFGADQKAETVHALLEENFLPPARYESNYLPVLVSTGQENILFDTGNGPLGRDKGSGNLAALLAESGCPPDKIDIVVITHCHPDHIGGLLEDGKPGFPNARYVFGAKEFDYWKRGEHIPEARKRTHDLFVEIALPFGNQATFIEPGDDVATGITAIEAFGHSPGHLAFHVESDGKQLMIWADTCNHYVVSLQRPDWHVAVDHDHAQAAATRKRIFDMVNADRIPVMGHHMPFPGIGYVEKRDSGYRWLPVSYQFDV